MKRFLIAAGVGALLIGGQTAVSAASGVADRLGPVEPAATASGAAATKAAGPAAPSHDVRAVRLDRAPGNLIGDLDETPHDAPRSAAPAPAAPSREAPVIDRLGGNAGSYNLALSAYSQASECQKSSGMMTSSDGKWAGKCPSSPDQEPVFIDRNARVVPIVGAAVAIGVFAVINDSGESD